jgi:polygalacturonase
MKCLLILSACSVILAPCLLAADFDVRAHGARGDGATLDTNAINSAIAAAAEAGGGTVRFPAGTYLSFSIRLRSNITLHLDPGSTILAATAAEGFGEYDAPEPNPWGDLQYQDFGHSHWHNSLIWGENLENVSITGTGRIDGGAGLSRDINGFRPGPVVGNKAIAIKSSRNVLIRDISILRGGHFAILLTGVDNVTLDNLRIDTNRDGIDIDACRNVRVSNCVINSPQDDALVLKSSYALGMARATENVTITNCQLTGYDVGTFFDGTIQRTLQRAPDRDGPTGRIKFGTESNGGFRNITISNCIFDRSRGIAIETVDGGPVEDVTITNITMRDVSNSPLFLRLGNRARGPEGTPVATMRRITISNLNASDADPRYASILAGLPGHPIEDVKLSNIRIRYRGGITMANVSEQPEALTNSFFQRPSSQRGGGPNGTTAPQGGRGRNSAANAEPTGPRDPFDVPERENGYPEPSMFGIVPAYGLFVRHVEGLTVENLDIGFEQPDERPAFVLMDVARADFDRVRAERAPGQALFVLRDVSSFSATSVEGLDDRRLAEVPDMNL